MLVYIVAVVLVYKDFPHFFLLQIHYMRLNSWFAIGPMCLSIFGILATSFVIITFVRYNETPVVRASGRELSYLLLSGCLICYLMSFILLLKPSGVTCAFQRFGIGLGFAVIYSSLLTKTNRISRIFASANQTARRPPFISPKSQLLISGVLIGMQILCTAIWVTLSPPGIRLDTRQKNFPILRCKIDDKSFLVSLVYNMLLICVCTVYAIKTRRIPENFNESKFIGFTMYTTCIIWLAFVPIYFGTLHTFEVQITTLCISISLSATVTLVCLFAPKVYIIFLQPEKNVRKLTMNSTSKKPNLSGSFINHRGDARGTVEYSPVPESIVCELVDTRGGGGTSYCTDDLSSSRNPPPYPADSPTDNNVIVNQREIDNNSITSL